MGRETVFASSIVLALGAANAAADPTPPRIAVVPGIAVNLDAAKVDALSQDLAEALSSQLVVDAVGGLEVRRQLPSDGLPADCVSNAACTADVAKRTGAAQLLFVVMVGGSGGAVQIDTTWIDSTTGKRVSRPAVDLTSSTDDAARGKFDSVAHTLLPDATVRVKPLPPPGRLSIDTKMTDPTPRHFTTPAVVTAAGAGVGLVAGTLFALDTRSKYNTCKDAAATCTQSNRDSISHFALAADVSFGIAIGAAIATGALYATSGEGPHVIVSPTPEGATASWIGRF
jgi:hypothetical protein